VRIFGQVVEVGADVKLIRMGTLAIDGTRCGKREQAQGMSYVRMKKRSES